MKYQIKEAEKKLLEIFEIVPFLNNIEITEQQGKSFILSLHGEGNITFNIHVICLERAVPQAVKKAIDQLDNSMYCIIMAPFISEASSIICKEAGAGYCDLSGNCWIITNNMIIVKTGNPNKYPHT